MNAHAIGWTRRVALLALALLLMGSVAPFGAVAARHDKRKGPDPQVVGGTPVPDGWYRFMVSLQVRRDGKWDHNCGGSLLDARHVLTAAHCVVENGEVVPPSSYRAVVGRTDLKQDQKKGQAIAIQRIDVPDEYATAPAGYDVAVMTLAKPVKHLTETVTLPAAGDNRYDQAGQDVIVAGWGNTIENDGIQNPKPNNPSRMRQASMLIADNAGCAQKYTSFDPTLELCATYPGRDSCQGDSGGPLFARIEQNGDVAYIQVGIVSYGHGCAWPGYAGIYTRVSAPVIRNFIQGAVGSA